MVDADFLPIFIDEAIETLERWEAACMKLESQASPALLDELFRSAHNIKGSSKSVGLMEYGNLVHKAEDLITKLKNGTKSIDTEVVSILLDTQKTLLDWTIKLRSDPEVKSECAHIVAKLESLLGNNSASDNAAPSNSHEQSNQPKDLGTILIESGQASPQDVEKAVALQNRKLGEVLVDSGVVSQDQVKAALDLQKSSGQKIDETIRVSLKKLDSVIRLIGELSIQHSIVKNAKDQETLAEPAALEAISLTQKVIQDLQSEAMSLRMQPLDGLFQRMERVCRDVARQQQKNIQVILAGTDVELDKTVIEKMKDPLVHILRNAVDHGIEDTFSRLETGKPSVASVKIEGIQTAANVSIRISDDGRGLNEEKILKKAKEKGLISPESQPSKYDIHQMIFLPGFSTADKVTDVSGRGVGMDVVKKAVDDLGGSISIESEMGRGTQFIINLPSTLSILDAVVVGLEDQMYAVPVQDVEEVVDMSSALLQTTTQKGRVINLRGRILPVEKLSDYLPNTRATPTTKPGIALITRHHSTTVAFEVDQVAGQQSIVVRQLEGKLAQVPGFAGGTILASGEPSMIIHLPQIVKSYIAVAK